MKIHVLQHVPFEDEAKIGRWAKTRGHPLSKTRLYEGEPFPPLEGFDLLVVMGGPMNIYEEAEYPWLAGEKRFIEKAINAEKKLLGVCLGAQLIASVLGSKVYRNDEKEIGWFPVELTREAKGSSLFSGLPTHFTSFHWHGDTFNIPDGSLHMAKSAGCANQAFEYEGRVVGLQFHLESSGESIQKLIEHCGEELVDGEYMQTADEMFSHKRPWKEMEGVLSKLLDNF